MYGFFIKKNFCDGWDNLFALVIPNLVMMAVTLVFAWLFTLLQENTTITILLSVLLITIINIFIMSFSDSASKLADFKSVPIKKFFQDICPASIKDGVFFGLLTGISFALFFVAVPFYFSQSSMISFFLGALLLWMAVFELLALQWFVAVRALLKGTFLERVKKCFIIMADNLGFSFFMLIYDTVLIALSVFFVGFLPSFAGITLAKTNALRLRLYKYDFLDAHPEMKTMRKKKIPWAELLADDREILGPRGLKSFIFPWK